MLCSLFLLVLGGSYEGARNSREQCSRQLRAPPIWGEQLLSSCSPIYYDLKFLAPTSNSVERLFSSAKFVLNDYRQSLSKAMFEAIMILKTNMDYWNALTVSSAMSKVSKEDAQNYAEMRDQSVLDFFLH